MSRKADITVTFTARLPRRVVVRLDKVAKDLGISRNSLMERVLGAAVDARSEQAIGNLFSTLGIDEMMKQAVEAALQDARRKLGST